MICRTEELIQKSLDGTLSPAERGQLDAHLPVCAACRRSWEENRRLAQMARRWVPRTEPADMSADEFTAQVLARIARSPQAAPVRRFLWRPLLAAGLTVALIAASLALLPHALRPAVPDFSALPDFRGAALALPGWLLANARALPGDTLTLWQAAQQRAGLPPWSWGLLGGAGAVNAAFYADAANRRGKGSVS